MKTHKHNPIPSIAAATLAAFTLPVFADESAERPLGPVNGDNPNIGIKYDEKQGLNVTPFSAKVLGLEMADVEEKVLVTERTLQLRTFDLSADGRARASAWIPAADASQIDRDTPVSLENGIVARVTEIAKEINDQVEVIVEIPSGDPPVKVGKFLAGTVRVQSQGEVVVVPKKAVVKSAEGPFAYADNSGWTIRTPVEIGLENEDEIEIVDGLYYGDRIVTHPVITLWMAELQLLKSGKA